MVKTPVFEEGMREEKPEIVITYGLIRKVAKRGEKKKSNSS